MKRSHMGFTAFAKRLGMEGLAAGEKGPVVAWTDYLQRLVAVGCDHVQFLVQPSDSPEDAAALGAIARDAGVREASTLYCTFHPVCPCADADAAFSTFTHIFAASKALMAPFTGMGVKRIFSPSFLRGLMDPNKGLADPSDTQKQVAFLERLQKYLKDENRGEAFELDAEPLNRFETRGPNTVADTVEIIKSAHASQRVKVGADSFHSFMERGSGVAEMWAEFAAHIGLIHASALGRGHFYDDVRWMEPLFQAVGRIKELRDTPIVIEGFCGETEPAFFPVLGIHEVNSCSAAELASGNLGCLRSWMRNP